MKKSALTLLSVVTVGLVLSACKSREEPPPPPAPMTTTTTGSYSYQSGK